MPPLLSLNNVHVSNTRDVRERRDVLTDISFDLDAGETLGLWGALRSGKTTLLLVAGGFVEPSSGTVKFAGQDFKAMSDKELAQVRRSEIGWVQREPPRLQLSAGEWIALAASDDHGYKHALHEAAQTLERVGIPECLKLPWAVLSDGERALVGIAAALVRKPRLLIADDLTHALDLDERERVTLMLRSLVREHGMAMLISAPDLPALAYTRRIASLDGGRLIMGSSDSSSGDGGDVVDIRDRRHG